MSNTFDTDQLLGSTVYDSTGAKVGKVGQVYLDDASGEPNWVTVNTGLFGTNESFVPLRGANAEGDQLHVPYTKDFIKDAPNVDEDGHIDESEEQQLHDYYAKDQGNTSRGAGHDADHGSDQGADQDAHRTQNPGPQTTADTDHAAAGGAGVGAADAGAGHDRDADRARDADRDRDAGYDQSRHDQTGGQETATGAPVGGGRQTSDTDDDRGTDRDPGFDRDTRGETSRARLRKHVVTDQQTVPAPVERDEVEVVRDPISDGGADRRDDRGGNTGERFDNR